MAAPNDLPARKAMLAAAEAELENRTRRFEDSIAELRDQRRRLRREYADALRAELARLNEPPATRTAHLGGILAAIERSQQPITIGRLRTLAGRYLPASDQRNPPRSD